MAQCALGRFRDLGRTEKSTELRNNARGFQGKGDNILTIQVVHDVTKDGLVPMLGVMKLGQLTGDIPPDYPANFPLLLVCLRMEQAESPRELTTVPYNMWLKKAESSFERWFGWQCSNPP
jgi:hypothetical protein